MNNQVLFLTHAAMIAAIYVVITVLFAPFSFGEVQVRVAEALTILPFFTPAAVPGLYVGCLIGKAKLLTSPHRIRLFISEKESLEVIDEECDRALYPPRERPDPGRDNRALVRCAKGRQ